MQLKMVVFPAPLGPMRPTISNSLTRRLTSVSACTPPKRMETPTASRTGIDPLGPAPAVAKLEPAALEPPAQRGGERAETLGLEDQGHDGEHAGQDLYQIGGVGPQGVG